MSNRITIELCMEDRQRLDDITGLLASLYSELKSNQPETVQIPHLAMTQAEDGTVKLVDLDHPVDAVAPHSDPEPQEEPKYTHKDILAKVQKLAAPGSAKRLAAKAVVTEYAEKVSGIPAEKCDEVMAKLIELEG
jgi:hypothetical protein